MSADVLVAAPTHYVRKREPIGETMCERNIWEIRGERVTLDRKLVTCPHCRDALGYFVGDP